MNMTPKNYAKKSVGFISLGCSKNLVDTEIMLGILVREGFQIVDPVEGCEIIIVNTCAFIDDAKEESIETILSAVEQKKDKKCRYILVTGCLSQRYSSQLYELIPEVDRIIGVSQIEELGWICRNLPERKPPQICEPKKLYPIAEFPKVHIPPNHYGFLKIADGCSNYCSYCVIPLLRGEHRSRTMDDILEEAAFLDEIGVKEINVIAQDITRYGEDLNGGESLVVLLENLLKSSSFEWIRLLYAYPYGISDELLSLMAREERIVPYLDIPVQHIDTGILKKMGRNRNSQYIYDLFTRIRSIIPNVSLRTTLIVGFPGETDEIFSQLIDFIETVRFDHLGVFKYSKESGTKAAKLKNHIPMRVKKSREKKLLELQAHISKSLLQERIGSTIDVLLEDKVQTAEEEIYIVGRAPFQAPEVDGTVLIADTGVEAELGSIQKVRITSTSHYDLFGTFIDNL